MDEENVVDACDGILVSLKKEGNPFIRYKMDEMGGPYEWWLLRGGGVEMPRRRGVAGQCVKFYKMKIF